jgi:hypothetical protein
MKSPIAVANCSFSFECPRLWSAMEETPSPKERTCRTCERSVHLVDSQAEWDAHAQRGDCVAVELPDGQMRLGETVTRYFVPESYEARRAEILDMTSSQSAQAKHEALVELVRERKGKDPIAVQALTEIEALMRGGPRAP